MAPVEPVPAALRVGEARLVRIGDDEAELLRKRVHPRANGEIFRVLRAAVQHDHQRQLALLVIGREIEPVVERTRRPADRCASRTVRRDPARAPVRALAAKPGGMIGRTRRARRVSPSGRRGANGMTFADGRGGRALRIATVALPGRVAGQSLADKRGRPAKIGFFHQPQSLVHYVENAVFHALFLFGMFSAGDRRALF